MSQQTTYRNPNSRSRALRRSASKRSNPARVTALKPVSADVVRPTLDGLECEFSASCSNPPILLNFAGINTDATPAYCLAHWQSLGLALR